MKPYLIASIVLSGLSILLAVARLQTEFPAWVAIVLSVAAMVSLVCFFIKQGRQHIPTTIILILICVSISLSFIQVWDKFEEVYTEFGTEWWIR